MVGRLPGAACASLVAVSALAAEPARAQPSAQDKALALQLFDEGKSLLAGGKVDEACHKLEESLRLDPLPGTLLNVAVCHEQEGRAASAVAEFREARALAQRDGRDDRVALADQHLYALDGKVSTLVIVVPPETDRPDLAIARDGTSVGRAAWGTRIPVDPGSHVIEASAADRKVRRITVSVAPGGEVQTAAVLPLEVASPAASTPPAPPPSTAPPEAAATPVAHGTSTRKTLALISAGVGVVWIGIGSYFGLTAISKHDDPNAMCSTNPCSQYSRSQNDTARTFADVSTASFAVGLVGLGLGTVLWLTDPGAPPGKTTVRVAPDVGQGRAGLQVGGRF